MKFICNSCTNVLSNDVSDSPTDICEEDGKDLIFPGHAIKDEDWSSDEWIINSKDLINFKVTEDDSRLNGCCDFDGCDGPNLRCSNCNEYVATARYDCWLPKHVILLKGATRAIT